MVWSLKMLILMTFVFFMCSNHKILKHTKTDGNSNYRAFKRPVWCSFRNGRTVLSDFDINMSHLSPLKKGPKRLFRVFFSGWQTAFNDVYIFAGNIINHYRENLLNNRDSMYTQWKVRVVFCLLFLTTKNDTIKSRWSVTTPYIVFCGRVD